MLHREARTLDDLEPGVAHRALLFDWDGTLADSQAANYRAIRAALNAADLDIEQDWFDARTGVSTRDMVAMIDLAAHRDRVYLGLLSDVGEVGHVTAILRREHGRRRTALATGGGAATVLPTAEALGLRRYFDVEVTRDDVERGKPAPDIFMRAAELLGVPAAGCLVYEDSDEGLAAAAAAGMDAIDVRPLRGSIRKDRSLR